jgi:hypothetical protein
MDGNNCTAHSTTITAFGNKRKYDLEWASSTGAPFGLQVCNMHLLLLLLLLLLNKIYKELEVATGTIRRVWARPSFCQNLINKRVRVAGELTFKVHGFGNFLCLPIAFYTAFVWLTFSMFIRECPINR